MSDAELASSTGVDDALELCYLLAYVCRKTPRGRRYTTRSASERSLGSVFLARPQARGQQESAGDRPVALAAAVVTVVAAVVDVVEDATWPGSCFTPR